MPKPTKFAKTNSIRQQIEHLVSELAEVRMALVDLEDDSGEAMAVALELQDVIVSATTAQAILGFDDNGRAKLSRMVTAKNKSRGYYEAVSSE